jgi:hypothetical protein
MSALDGRIRTLAREEAAALLGVATGIEPATGGEPTAANLQQQITDLHEHLHHAATTIARLDKRVDALEAAAAGPINADTPVRATAEAPRPRGRRKATEE